MERATKFVQLYNSLAEHLRKQLGADPSESFSRLIDRASGSNPLIRARASELKDYGDLRNAILHHRSYPLEIIAEPTVSTVERFKDLLLQVTLPPQLIPKFARDVECFAPDDSLVGALHLMRENDFSQVVVRLDDGMMTLLTVEGVARWVEKQAVDDIISVADARIRDALACDLPDSCLFMARNRSVFDAYEGLTNPIKQGTPRVFAIVITNGGDPLEKPLGIITIWDLLDEFESLR